MYYPGQAVYVPTDKRLGIYVGFTHASKYPYAAYACVFVYLGEEDSAVELFEFKDVRPLAKPDKKSLTDQVSYSTPQQKTALSRSYSDEEFDALKSTFLAEMQKILRSKWAAKYEFDVKQ